MHDQEESGELNAPDSDSSKSNPDELGRDENSLPNSLSPCGQSSLGPDGQAAVRNLPRKQLTLAEANAEAKPLGISFLQFAIDSLNRDDIPLEEVMRVIVNWRNGYKDELVRLEESLDGDGLGKTSLKVHSVWLNCPGLTMCISVSAEKYRAAEGPVFQIQVGHLRRDFVVTKVGGSI